MRLGLFFIFMISLMESALADKKRSLIDSDPLVIYVRDLKQAASEVSLKIVQPTAVYATKNGGRKLGFLKDGQVKLIGFDHRACKIQGQGLNGWVAPRVLQTEKGNFQELVSTVYARETTVRALIAAGEIALGMTELEVVQVLGKPTKRSTRRTADTFLSRLEFVEFEEVEHFDTVFDRRLGRSFRRFSHTTLEERARINVEFDDGVVIAMEESENSEGGTPQVVSGPLFF